jgi:hypothetical protein
MCNEPETRSAQSPLFTVVTPKCHRGAMLEQVYSSLCAQTFGEFLFFCFQRLWWRGLPAYSVGGCRLAAATAGE